MRYDPLLLVTAVRDPCSDALVAVQVTPGSAAPEESVTTPVMSPVVWANARLPAAAATMAMAASRTRDLRNLIDFPPLLFRFSKPALDEKDESPDEDTKLRDDTVRCRAIKLPNGIGMWRTVSGWYYGVKRIPGTLTPRSGIRVSE
jgi:hypothetical protein